jgi:hypothetical protein
MAEEFDRVVDPAKCLRVRCESQLMELTASDSRQAHR